MAGPGDWVDSSRGRGAHPAGPVAPWERGRRDESLWRQVALVAVLAVWRRPSGTATKQQVIDLRDEEGSLD